MDVFRLFRALIYASLALLVLSIAAVFVEPQPPDSITDYFVGEAAGPLYSALNSDSLAVQIPLVILLLAFLCGYLAAMVGMLGFHPWARRLYLITTIAGFALLPLSGGTYAMPIEGTLSALLHACEGALLMLLFVEPVRGRFLPAPAAHG